MRVALEVTPFESERPTGVARRLAGELRALAELPRKALEGWRFLLVSRREVSIPVDLPPCFESRATGGGSLALWRELRLAPTLARDRVDVLHSPFTAIPIRGAFRKIATVHELSWMRAPGVEGRLHAFKHRCRLRAAARHAFRIVTPSETTRDDVATFLPRTTSRLRVIPPVLDPMFFDAGNAERDRAVLARIGIPDRPYVLMVAGNLGRARKNLSSALRIHAAFTRRVGEPVPLVVVGEGGAGALGAARDPAAQSAAPIVATGYVADAVLPALYRRARVLLHPSVTEGFGFPPLEAMACGLPVVASTGGSVPEAVGHAALLADPADVEAFAEALARLFGDESLRDSMGEGGRLRAASFSGASLGVRLLDLYRGR